MKTIEIGKKDITNRCPWAKSEYEIEYHDLEWCRPLHDDRAMFELLILEGMQAGVSWNIILKKRKAFQEAFDSFVPEIVAGYTEEKIEELMLNPGILRNRNKIRSTVSNARAFMEVQKEFGSFDKYIWSFTKGEVIDNRLERTEDLPASSPLSERVSRDLKKRGFKYAGPVIIYSYLQAVGIVNDHVTWCDCYKEQALNLYK